MTRVVENPDAFVEDALEGFARVHSDLVRRVDGGIVRAHPLAPGQVAVVIGGGSGHYPAFAGLVGEGLAAGAVCGNIFSSPSAGQAYRVAEAANAGGGVLFSYGNYAGDVIHFGEAENRLNAAGIDTRTVLVTDDIASAGVHEIDKRRGIAGDLCVFRIAGAAAERGAPLDEVERLARKANARTRTLGVAFSGCTLPGASEALFSVAPGMMSVGLGIHGEPGIRDVPLQSAKDLARTLIEPLLDERPEGAGDRVVLILNGLGSVKYEELFVLYRYASDLLVAAGLEIVQPECGELVTSLDMGGVSATLLWLDAELDDLWSAPAATPAYRKGVVAPRAGPRAEVTTVVHERTVVEASASSRAAATVARRMITVARNVVAENVDELGRLDAVAGDGDHGIGMLRGLDAAHASASSAGDLGIEQLLVGAGESWSEVAGGTSGALWGAALAAIGASLGDRETYTPADVRAAVSSALARVQQLGKAEPGDKTMIDALVPFDETMGERLAAGDTLAEALAAAATAAEQGAAATAALTPRLGRARPLAERSKGHVDPGATSLSLIVRAIATEVAS